MEKNKMPPPGPQFTETHRLTGIQFGLLSQEECTKLSVMPAKQGITKNVDLNHPQLGVPNKESKCFTCNGSRRGGCDGTEACDGHFGHINLALPIWNPHYVRSVLKVLQNICLNCSRYLAKAKRKNQLDEIFEGDDDAPTRKRKASAGGGPAGKRRARLEKTMVAQILGMPNLEPEVGSGIRDVKEEILDATGLGDSGGELRGMVKYEPVEIPDDAPTAPEVPGRPRSQLLRPGAAGLANGAEPHIVEEAPCKYCGGHQGKKLGVKLPRVKLRVISKATARKGKIDTLQMFVEEKAGELPEGFWDFVHGHPGLNKEGGDDKIRMLLPGEALAILRKINPADMKKLNMDEIVSLPETLIIRKIAVTPNCLRLITEDWSSSAPKLMMQRGQKMNGKLEPIVRKAKQLQELLDQTKGESHYTQSKQKLPFKDLLRESEDMQVLVARHYRACKVYEYRMKTDQEIEETGGSLELKWLKANVLAKRSDQSARTVINGDPCIQIGEIGVPKEVAERLTVTEKVNSLNIKKWKKEINDYMRADPAKTQGVFELRKIKGERPFKDLRQIREICQQGVDIKIFKIEVNLGDTITRHLQDGDEVFANRPPSLHKHSLITLKVKVHPCSTFAVNPLICPPFEADFDGDAFHIFVPQSIDSKTELKELMSVQSQMISPQGGQPLVSLTQDSLLGAHLLIKSREFLNRSEIQHLAMWCNSEVPEPAIIKAEKAGPLWTGKQLFGMTLPAGMTFGNLSWTGRDFEGNLIRSSYGANGDVLIVDGELLISRGGAKWLERSANGIVRAIHDYAGPKVALEHLDCLQSVVHQWLLLRGFSVGLSDFNVGKDAKERNVLRHLINRNLVKANDAGTRQALKVDRELQLRMLFPQGSGLLGSVDMTHRSSFGLLLGDGNSTEKVTALQGAAVEGFQRVAPNIDFIIARFMADDNRLQAMVKSGSKGSNSKVSQQAGCLGLQLYKGESPLKLQYCSKLAYFNSPLEKARAEAFQPVKMDFKPVGYWESRGIISSSYFDGLNPLEFYMDAIASRSNVMRSGIEEPNKILKGLMLFMRDMHVAYDGTVRLGTTQHIMQFRYGGLQEDSRNSNEALPSSSGSSGDWLRVQHAGEPVGAVAATSISEPAYNMKMQSIHQTQLLGAGPVKLLQETLINRYKTKMKLSDRRCILRLPKGFGRELSALRIVNELKKTTLKMITIKTCVTYMPLDNRLHLHDYTTKKGISDMLVVRMSTWMGRIELDQNTMKTNDLNIKSIVQRLNEKHRCKTTDKSTTTYHFKYSTKCNCELHPDGKSLCIWFWPVSIFEGEASTATSTVLENFCRKKGENIQSVITMLPAILSTIIRGSDEIEKSRLLWEQEGSAARLPPGKSATSSASKEDARLEGELVVEVVVKAPRGSGKRGSPWASVKEACIMIMHLIDWNRSGPYSVQETNQCYGIEAARMVILKRLTTVIKTMGKPVLEEHLILAADTMTHCGEVIGMSLAGYRDSCRHLSMSSPLTEATFQQPKKTFLDAASRGASEGIEGALPSSVWGRRVPLGTGINLEIRTAIPKLHYQTKPLGDPLDIVQALESQATRRTSSKPSFKHRIPYKKTAEAFQDGEYTAHKSVLQGQNGIVANGQQTLPQRKEQNKAPIKRALENGGELASKLRRIGKGTGRLRMQGDAAVIRVNDPRRVAWAMPGHFEADSDDGMPKGIAHSDNVNDDDAKDDVIPNVATGEDTIVSDRSIDLVQALAPTDGRVSAKGTESTCSAIRSCLPAVETIVFSCREDLIDSRQPPTIDQFEAGIDQLIFQEREEWRCLLHARHQTGPLPPDEEQKVLDEVLAYHPQSLEKIGCGVAYVKVDFHQDFPTSKCFHIVRIDNTMSDFSYHKCLDHKAIKRKSQQQP